MFVGSKGWVLKPKKMITGVADEMARKVKFTGEIAGISSCESLFSVQVQDGGIANMYCIVPRPDNDDSFTVFVRAELFHSGVNQEWKSKVVKVKDAPETGANISWIEIQQFEWEYESEDLVFIRCVAHI
jgi:phosphatidylinositol phospholipase C, delta